MSEPTNQEGRQAPAAKVRRGQVVSYVFADQLGHGRTVEGLAVVLGVDTGPDGDPGELLALRPLSDHTLYVAPEDVSPVAAGDVAPG
jgi:hypothetical protein